MRNHYHLVLETPNANLLGRLLVPLHRFDLIFRRPVTICVRATFCAFSRGVSRKIIRDSALPVSKIAIHPGGSRMAGSVYGARRLPNGDWQQMKKPAETPPVPAGPRLGYLARACAAAELSDSDKELLYGSVPASTRRAAIKPHQR